MIQENQPTTEEPWNRRWAIILKVVDAEGDGQEQARREKMIGIIGTPRKGEIGYKIHPGYWGKGYMSEALALFLDMWWGMEGKVLVFTFILLSASSVPACISS